MSKLAALTVQPAGPAFWVRPPDPARSNTATALLFRDVAYTFAPSGLMVSGDTAASALPVWSQVPDTSALAAFTVQPAAAASCVGPPEEEPTSKAAIALEPAAATYAFSPSGLSTSALGLSIALPVLSQVAMSVPGPSTTQPAAPAFCVSAPLPCPGQGDERIAEEAGHVTLSPSGLTATARGWSSPLPALSQVAMSVLGR